MPATAGGYELLQRLAVGGMAEVFLARRPGPEGFEKLVALKRILPHLAKQPDFVNMFLDEARLAASLSHPHIVQTFDFGADAGSYFIAMEYVCGEDVQSLARAALDARQPLPLADVVTILVDACAALEHAHEKGIVHRDVTPANLLVGYDGVVKLADFGIAKSQALVSRSRTTVGTLKGKVPYMSPEQARAQQLDTRSDIFSLGVVAWELIAGQRLFQRRHELDMLRAVQMCDVPPLARVRPDVPPELAAAVATALRPAREERWQTAGDFARALVAWLASTGQSPSAERLRETIRRLFGDDAAARKLVAARTSGEATGVLGLHEARFSPLHPERWIPQIAMHLHLPPPRMRLVLPFIAILISGGGLLFGLKSPHAHRALSAGVVPVAAPIVAAPPPANAGPATPPRPVTVDSSDAHSRHRTARANRRR